MQNLFVALDEGAMSWCVLHDYQSLPGIIRSDVDCLMVEEAMPPHSGLLTVMQRVGRETGAYLVQWLQHEATAHYFVFATKPGGRVWEFLRFDVSSDYRRNGRVFYDGRAILAERRPVDGFWVPAPRHEFGYYLVKKIAKGQLSAEHGHRLSEVYVQDPVGCQGEIRKFWAGSSAHLLEQAAATGDWSAVQARIRKLRRELLGRRALHHPLQTGGYVLADATRRARRWAAPTGLQVVILGPDGSGKSTVADAVLEGLTPAFRRTARFHFLPRLFRRTSGSSPMTDPHGTPPRSGLASVAKAAYWLADALLGYAVTVRPALVRSTLVVFDRYLVDALVDPRRYRYGGPDWLLRLVWRAVPKPDLVILLDAPVEVLQARKQEVTPEECARQRAAYRALVERMPNGYIVDASRPLPEVVTNVEDIVIRHMAQRTAQRLNLDNAL